MTEGLTLPSDEKVLVRSLLKSERPSGLTQAIIEVGRINKTLYLLTYIDDEDPNLTGEKAAMLLPELFVTVTKVR